jgi:putative SOS response-associated peptidase YedK
MCGRVKLEQEVTELRIALKFPADSPMPNLQPSWNLCPTQDILVARRDADTGRRLPEVMHWGLVPRWSRTFKMERATFNAKVETVHELPTFKEAWKQGRRCLVVTDGWYEWRQAPDKQPFFIRAANSKVTVMAGLWEEWKDGLTSERRKSCTVITTTPNNAMAALPHDRMPVVLDEVDWPIWLGELPGDPDEVRSLLRPYAGTLELWPVSKRVGNVKNNDADLWKAIDLTAVVEEPKAKRAAKADRQGNLF